MQIFQQESRYRALLKAGDIPQIREEFPQFFSGTPATDPVFSLENVTRPDLAARMRGLYFKRTLNESPDNIV